LFATGFLPAAAFGYSCQKQPKGHMVLLENLKEFVVSPLQVPSIYAVGLGETNTGKKNRSSQLKLNRTANANHS
jgi:hypothetical protein